MEGKTKYYLAQGFGYMAPYPKEKPVYEPLPDRYFSNEKVKWAITLMVCHYIPKRRREGGFEQNKDGSYKIVENKKFYRQKAQLIWEDIIAKAEDFYVQESSRDGLTGIRYERNKIIIEVKTDVEKDFFDFKSEYETSNIELNMHELIHVHQFLHGRIWFTSNNSSAWKPECDIFDEAEAFKEAAKLYYRESYYKSDRDLFENESVKIPSLSMWYSLRDTTLEEIVKQITEGIKAKVRCKTESSSEDPQKKTESVKEYWITYEKQTGIYDNLPRVRTSVPPEITTKTRTNEIFAYPYNEYSY